MNISFYSLSFAHNRTQGKHVEGNQEGTINIKKMRTWRQYMNRYGSHFNASLLYITHFLHDRRGGFNRYLHLLAFYLLQAYAVGTGHWTRSSNILLQSWSQKISHALYLWIQVLSWTYSSISPARAILVDRLLYSTQCAIFKPKQSSEMKPNIYLEHSYQQLMYWC